jgi:formylglycine-generating enzyme required for sulfatase activity
MNKYLVLLFLAFIVVIIVILQVGIRRSGTPQDIRIRTESEDQGYEPMAKKVQRAKEELALAEREVEQASLSIHPAFESMVFIPAGEFTLGYGPGLNNEKPERRVSLKGFFMDVYEVTFAQYYAFVRATGHRKPRLAGYLGVESADLPYLLKPDSPVVGVSWYDAADYCAWKGKRLPTEAEWEKAAKGTGRQRWPWGDEELPKRANLQGTHDGFDGTVAVDRFKEDVSPYGVYGMAGNVMEWTQDWYDEVYYEALPASDPPGPPSGQERVIRGASWHDSIQRARTTARFKAFPEYRDVTIGFRCARSS